ncbi:MAG: hypothetical protein V9E84_00490 [Trichococcus flocculiformis]
MKMKGYPLPVTGYESYIGQSIAAYTAKHGQPNRVGKSLRMAVNGGYSGQMLRTTSK